MSKYDEAFKRIEEFEKLVRPLQAWMLENYSQHTSIIISKESARITTDAMGIPLNVKHKNDEKVQP